MPETDSIIAITALFSTIALSTIDINEGGHVLGIKDPFSSPQSPTTILRRGFSTGLTSTAESSVRGLTSLAFFYLAYRDYTRATRVGGTADSDVVDAAWRAKVWAGCGVAGVAVGPLGPFSRLWMGPIERRLRARAGLEGAKVGRLVKRWGRLTSGRGMFLLASVPVGIKAYRLLTAREDVSAGLAGLPQNRGL